MNSPDLLAAVVALAPLAFIVTWLVETGKDATNQNWNGLATRLVAFCAAFLTVTLFAHSPFGSDLPIGATTLGRAGWSACALIGLAICAGGGTLTDYLRARNQADTTTLQRLLPPASSDAPPQP